MFVCKKCGSKTSYFEGDPIDKISCLGCDVLLASVSPTSDAIRGRSAWDDWIEGGKLRNEAGNPMLLGSESG